MPTPPSPAVRALEATNIAVVSGSLAAAVRSRELPSGERIAEFDVVTRGASGTAGVPVVWIDPSAEVADLAPGDELVVAGFVRRRFFRAGGATQSRTELIAAAVVPTRRRAAVRRLLTGIAATLQTAADER